MAKNKIAVAALLLIGVALNAQENRLHTVFEMNSSPAVINSHAGEEQWSRFQPIHSHTQLVKHDFLVGSLPDFDPEKHKCSYPRIKKMASGEYILFCMPTSHGTSIFYTISQDLKTWSEPVLLLETYRTVVADKEVQIRYVNMDAAVLPNGDLLGVCQFWCTEHYKAELGTGLVTLRSKDNGRTWSEPQVIYEGANWEPYLLVLPDGNIHCYFTDSTPETWNSGTSVMVSSDNGHTWTAKKRVCRNYKYEYDKETTKEKSIYTDQMPSFRVLNDGKTLVGFLEGRLATPLNNSGKMYHRMSVVYNDGFHWKDLGEDSEGPEHRHTYVIGGGAGYVETFPSGEVALACGRNYGGWSIKLVDHNGGRYANVNWLEGWFAPFNGRGGWGALERINDNMLIGMAGESKGGIHIGLMYLNNRISAKSAKTVLDGKTDEWQDTDALFISAQDGCETIFRASHDEEYLYILSETASPAHQSTFYELNLCNSGSDKVQTLSINASGAISSTSEKIKVLTSRGRTKAGVEGFSAEISIPLALLEAEIGDYLRIYVETEGETFTDSSKENTDSWMRIRLE